MKNYLIFIICVCCSLELDAQTYIRPVGPTSSTEITANGWGPMKMNGQSVNRVATFYDACELGMRKKGVISKLKYTLSTPLSIPSGQTVEVWMKNVTRCDLNELDPWNNITGDVSWLGNCQISPSSTNTSDVVISLSESFEYDGEGLEIYFQMSSSLSSDGFQSFVSPGNVQTWNNYAPIWYTGMVKPIVEITYSLPTLDQTYSSSTLNIVTCDGDQSFCVGEEVCLSLDHAGVLGQQQNPDLFADNSLSFRWQFAPSSTPTTYANISNPAISYIPQDYVPSYPANNYFEEIVNVTLGALNQSSVCGQTGTGANSIQGAYSDYTSGSGAPSIPNLNNTSNTISISIASCDAEIDAFCAAYIDFNHDGDFNDLDENVFTSANLTAAGSVSGTFPVPLGAIDGVTRLRVICSYGSIASPGALYDWGETEDYRVNIVNRASASTSLSFVPSGSGNVRCRVFDNSTGTNYYVGPISLTANTSTNTMSCYEAPEMGMEVGSRITRVVLSKKDLTNDEFVPLLISNTNGEEGFSATASILEVRTDIGQPLDTVNWNPTFNEAFNYADFTSGMIFTGLVPKVRAGDEMKLELKMNKAAKPSMFNHVARMEFDWDGDNIFETYYYFDYSEGTPLYQVPATQSDQEPIVLIGPLSNSIEYAKTIIVPCSALANTTTKFRATLRKLPTGWDEGEDYSIKTLCPIPRITHPGTPVICVPGSKMLTAVLSCPANGTYQWKKDGVAISGATASTYNATTGGSYTVVFTTASGTCIEESTPLVLTALSLPAPTLVASGSLSFCQGGNVTFSTSLTYPNYLWSNGASSSSITISVSGSYNVTVTDLNGCTATSANSNVVVTPNVTPSITISTTSTTICSGAATAFTATTTTGGSSPVYQWKLNGVNVGTNSTSYSNSSLNNGDQITCVLTANNTCQSSSTATSNALTMTVLNNLNYYNDLDGDGFGAGTATSACSPIPGMVTTNTDCNDAAASIYPSATEICGNAVDEDCSGMDLGCLPSSMIITPFVGIGQFGYGVQSTQSVNLNLGNNSVESPGGGNDLWFSFIAQGNAARIALAGSTSVADDNEISVYTNSNAPGVQWVPLSVENDVSPTNLGVLTPLPDGGSEVLIYGNFVHNQTYLVCVRNVNAVPGICQLTISYLKGSSADIMPFTGGTGYYVSTCANFKATFRSQSAGYIVNRWIDAAAANGAAANPGVSTPVWSFAIPPQVSGVGYTICQLGKIFPANLTGIPLQHFVTVDVLYNLKDAAGNLTPVTSFGIVASPVGLNAESPLVVRSTDLCSVGFKRTTAFIATNRSVCGTARYDWKFKMVYPTQGLPTYIAGGGGATRLVGMGSIPGIANGQRYDVWVRAAHLDGVSYSVGTAVGSPLQVNTWFPTTGGCPSNTSATCDGNASCVKTIGNAGMVLAEQENGEEVNAWSAQNIQLFPNPNAGHEVMLSVTGMEGVITIEVMDAMGRLLQSTTSYSEGHITPTLSFEKALSSGLYEVRVSNGKEQRVVRMVVGR